MDQGVYGYPPVELGQKLRTRKALSLQVQDVLRDAHVCQLAHGHMQRALGYYFCCCLLHGRYIFLEKGYLVTGGSLIVGKGVFLPKGRLVFHARFLVLDGGYAGCCV
jgi:hypothetical protein